MTIRNHVARFFGTTLTAVTILFVGSVHADTQHSVSATVLVSDQAAGVRSIVAADLDNDGDLDMLAGLDDGEMILWYENLDGAGTLSSSKIIANNVENVQSITTADFDGDGDIDVASVMTSSSDVLWYENPGAETVGDPNAIWSEHRISANFSNPSAVVACDINLDSKPDLAAADLGTQKVVWFENVDGLGNFGAEHIIADSLVSPYAIVTGDLNHDSYPDVAVAASTLNGLRVYLNSDGEGAFVAGSVEPLGYDHWRSVQVADIDGDSHQDLVGSTYAQAGRIVWFSNPDGDGNFGNPQIVTEEEHRIFSIATADLDEDGDPEILYTSPLDNLIACFDNLDNSDEFSSKQIIAAELPSASTVLAADLTGDGQLDVIGGGYFYGFITYYEVESHEFTPVAFGDSHFMTPGFGARTLKLADFNQDGYLDLAGGGNTGMRIFLNDPSGGPFTPVPSDATTTTIFDLEILDFDEDDHLDVMLAGNVQDNPICLNINRLDSDGDFQCSVAPELTNGGSYLSCIALADMDGDGDQDILYGVTASFAYPDAGHVAWIENTSGWMNLAGPEHLIASMGRVHDLQVADLNQDGLDDIVLALPGPLGIYDGELAWLERLNISGDFAPLASIDTTIGGVNCIQFGDADRDGDLDLFATAWEPAATYWYENTSADPNQWPRTMISYNQLNTYQLRLGDLDRDDDLDVCVIDSDASKLACFINTDGLGAFSSEQVISTELTAGMTLELADMDADGDLDAIVNSGHGTETSPFGQTEWFENLIDPYDSGDLNCDGAIDAFDIDAFIQALLYPYGYSQDRPDCGWRLADINGDSAVDAFDIEPFIDCLLGVACP